MGKTQTVASKFTEEELDKIDFYVKLNNTTRSALFHDLVMQGVSGENKSKYVPSDLKEVTFLFKDNFAYFWKDREYKGIIVGNNASIHFGGELKTYRLDELPVEIIE